MNTIPRAVAGSSVPTTFLAKTASSYTGGSSGSGPFAQRQGTEQQHPQFAPHAPFHVVPGQASDQAIPAGAAPGVGVGIGVVTGVAPMVTGGAPAPPVPGAGSQAIRSGMSVEDLKRLTAQRQQAQAALMSGQLQAQHAHMHAHAHGHGRMHGHGHGARHHHHRHRHHRHHHRHHHGHHHGHVLQHGFHSFVPVPTPGHVPPQHAPAQPFVQGGSAVQPPQTQTVAPDASSGSGGAPAGSHPEPWAFGAGSAVPFGVSAFGAAPHGAPGGSTSSGSPWAPQPPQTAVVKDDAASVGQQAPNPQRSGAGAGEGTALWARGTWGPVVAPTPAPDKPLAFAALPGLSLNARLGDTSSAVGSGFVEHAEVDEMERPGSACAVSDPDEDLMRVMEETGLSTVLDFDMGDARSVASVGSVGMGAAMVDDHAAALPLASNESHRPEPVNLMAGASEHGASWGRVDQAGTAPLSTSLFGGWAWHAHA